MISKHNRRGFVRINSTFKFDWQDVRSLFSLLWTRDSDVIDSDVIDSDLDSDSDVGTQGLDPESLSESSKIKVIAKETNFIQDLHTLIDNFKESC